MLKNITLFTDILRNKIKKILSQFQAQIIYHPLNKLYLFAKNNSISVAPQPLAQWLIVKI